MLKRIKRWSRHHSPVFTPFSLGIFCALGRDILGQVFPATPVAATWVFLLLPLILFVLNYPFFSYRRCTIVTTSTFVGLFIVTPLLEYMQPNPWAQASWFSLVVFGVVMWLLLIGIVAAVVAVRRALIKGHGLGRCRKCGYSRAGLPSDTCPECGTTEMPNALPQDDTNAVSRANRLLHDQYFNLPAMNDDEPNRRLLIPFACTATSQETKPGAAAAGPQIPLFAASLRIEQVLSHKSSGMTNLEVYTLNRLEISREQHALTLYLVANEDLLIEIEVAALDVHIDLSDIAVGHKRVLRLFGLAEFTKHAATQINWRQVQQWITEMVK